MDRKVRIGLFTAAALGAGSFLAPQAQADSRNMTRVGADCFEDVTRPGTAGVVKVQPPRDGSAIRLAKTPAEIAAYNAWLKRQQEVAAAAPTVEHVRIACPAPVGSPLYRPPGFAGIPGLPQIYGGLPPGGGAAFTPIPRDYSPIGGGGGIIAPGGGPVGGPIGGPVGGPGGSPPPTVIAGPGGPPPIDFTMPPGKPPKQPEQPVCTLDNTKDCLPGTIPPVTMTDCTFTMSCITTQMPPPDCATMPTLCVVTPPTPTPEPATFGVLATGLVGVAAVRGRGAIKRAVQKLSR